MSICKLEVLLPQTKQLSLVMGEKAFFEVYYILIIMSQGKNSVLPSLIKITINEGNRGNLGWRALQFSNSIHCQEQDK